MRLPAFALTLLLASPAWSAAISVEVRLLDLPVIDQDGHRLRFTAEALGRGPVVINTIYTACGTLCPLTSTVMQSLQDELAAQGRDDVRLLSLTVDPGRDGPDALAAMARNYAAGPGWRFLTGDLPDMLRLLDGLGVPLGAPDQHPPLFLIGRAGSKHFLQLEGLPTAANLLALLDVVPSR